MTEIRSIARFRIHDGQRDAFEALADACVAVVRERDTGTLGYDVFYSPDRTECVIHERYASSEALLEHVGNLGDRFGSMLGLSDFSAELFGAPSQALLGAVDGLDVAVYGHAASA